MKKVILRIYAAVGFLTILPVAGRSKADEENNVKELGRSSAYFPVVGLIVGMSLWLALLLLNFADISPTLKSAIIVILLTLITGGLHLDGLADTFDALASGWNRQRALEIMKEGGIGPYGTVAIVFALLLKVFIIAELVPVNGYLWFLIFPVIARWSMVLSMNLQPPAREDGLGKVFIENSTTKELGVATLITLALSLYILKAMAIPLILLITIITVSLSWLFKNKFGGITGDTLGAVCEINEIAVLIIMLAAV